MKNMGPAVRRRCFPYAWLRDFGILVYLLLLEWSSIPALWEVLQARPRFRVKRARLESSRRVSDAEIARWFSFTPQARNLDHTTGGDGEIGHPPGRPPAGEG
jgi:hypothetical protein